LEDQGLDVGELIDDVERALDKQLEAQELDEVIQDMERLAEASSEAVAEQVREMLAYLKAQRKRTTRVADAALRKAVSRISRA